MNDALAAVLEAQTKKVSNGSKTHTELQPVLAPP